MGVAVGRKLRIAVVTVGENAESPKNRPSAHSTNSEIESTDS
jgi:hypothetical protein